MIMYLMDRVNIGMISDAAKEHVESYKMSVCTIMIRMIPITLILNILILIILYQPSS